MTYSSNEMPIPSSGMITDKYHFQPVRIYYADTDAGMIVYHANYLNFAERGRTEFLRVLDLEQHKIKSDYGALFVVRHVEMDFRAPAKLDDSLLVRTAITHLGGASLTMQQDILSADQATIYCQIKVRIVCVDFEKMKSIRLPDHIRSCFQNLLVAAPE